MELEFRNTPEDRFSRAERRDRTELNSLEAAARSYALQAEEVLRGEKAMIVRNEIAPFAKDVLSSDSSERNKILEILVGRLKGLVKTKIFETIPDEQERTAFTLALVQAYQKSLQ